AVLGVILTFGSQSGISPLVLLVYPILAAALAIDWAQHDLRISNLGGYILTHCETRCPGIQWEHHLRSKPSKFRLAELSAIGVFGIAEVLAMSLAVSRVFGETVSATF